MAYTAKTWATNEVITSTALNNLETGAEEAYLMSEQVIDADKDWNDKAITNVKKISSTVGAVLSGAAPINAAYRIASEGGTITTPDSGISGWYNLGGSYTIPSNYGYGGYVRLAITTATPNPANLRVIKNGVAVDAGAVSVDPGDVFQGQYNFAIEKTFTIAWALYAYETPLFPPRNVV